MRLPRTITARARAEEGAFLIEILASCLILAIVLAGLVGAFDTAAKISGTERHRGVAADLAQTELDTVKSMTYAELRALTGDTVSRQVTTDNVAYTVTRSTRPASASEIAKGCSNAVSRDILRVRATVSWPKMGGAKPVQMDTLVASPVGASGSVVVKVIDRTGKGLPGISGSLGNQGNAVTDTNGCARWDDVPPGDSYALNMSKAGYVQPDGTPTITENIDVKAEQTVTFQYELDHAARVGPRFVYRQPGIAQTRWRADGDPKFVTIAHSRLSGGKRVFTLGNTPEGGAPAGGAPDNGTWMAGSTQAIFMVANLFPFASAYEGYPDQCESAKGPSPYAALSAPLGPDFFFKPADFKMPAIDIRVRQSNPNVAPPNGTATTGPRIKVKSPCGTEWDVPADVTVAVDGARKTARVLGFPYGTGYRLCAYAAEAPATKWERITDFSNTAAVSGTQTLQYDKNQNGSNQPCGNDW